jgi:hypothetical protein
LDVEILQTAKNFPGKLGAGDYFVETILAYANKPWMKAKIYGCMNVSSSTWVAKGGHASVPNR